MAEIRLARVCKLILGLLLAGVVAQCSQERMEGKILSEHQRDDGRVVAITTQTGGNATVSAGYIVYVRSNAPESVPSEVLSMDKGDAPVVSWTKDGKLLVNVRCGQIFHFTNFGVIKSRRTGEVQKLPVVLRAGGFCPNT